MTQTQHTDEPSVDDLMKLCDEVLKMYPVDDQTHYTTIARALRSRLSHPTLSADRNAVIEECANYADAHLGDHRPSRIGNGIRALKQ